MGTEKRRAFENFDIDIPGPEKYQVGKTVGYKKYKL